MRKILLQRIQPVFFGVVAVIFCAGFGGLEQLFAPKAELWSRWQAHNASITDLRMGDDGKLISASQNGELTAWDLPTHTLDIRALGVSGQHGKDISFELYKDKNTLTLCLLPSNNNRPFLEKTI